MAALKQTGSSSAPPPSAPPTSQSMYYPPATGGAPSYGLPPNMAHLGALFAQLPPHQAAAAAAAIQQLQPAPNYGAPPPPPMVPPMPPPSALYGAPQAQAPYSYPPASQGPNNNYGNPNLYQPQQGGPPPPNSAPPEAARYNYGASAPNPPAASSTNAQSIQDIMALLVCSSQVLVSYFLTRSCRKMHHDSRMLSFPWCDIVLIASLLVYDFVLGLSTK